MNSELKDLQIKYDALIHDIQKVLSAHRQELQLLHQKIEAIERPSIREWKENELPDEL